MSGSTWTWLGNNTAWADSSNWSLGQGPGNANNYPAPGDTALLDGGAVQPLAISGSQLNSNTINLSGNPVLEFTNGSTLDAASLVSGTSGTIVVNGLFTDIGNIEIDGPATLNVQIESGGTLLSDGLGGRDLGLNVGNPFTNPTGNGTMLISGGTIDNQEIHVNGGTAAVSSVLTSRDLISLTGGLVDLTQQSTVSPSSMVFVATGGLPSTMKFENPTMFNGDAAGFITGFASGDTLDIASGSVAKLVYNFDSYGNGDLVAEDANGAAIFSAILTGGDSAQFQTGTFAVASTGTSVAGSLQLVQSSGQALILEATPTPTPTPTPAPTPAPTPTVEAPSVPGRTDLAIQNDATGQIDYLEFSGTSLVQSALVDYGISGFKVVAQGDFNNDGHSDLLVQNPLTGQADILFLDAHSNLIASALTAPLPKIVGAGIFGSSGAVFELMSQLPNGQLDALQLNAAGMLTGSDLISNSVGFAPVAGIGGASDPNNPGSSSLPAFAGVGGSSSNVVLQGADGSIDIIGFSGQALGLSASASFLMPGTGGFAHVAAVNQTGSAANLDIEENLTPALPSTWSAAAQMVTQLPNGQLDLAFFNSGFNDPGSTGALYASTLLNTSVQGWTVIDGSAAAENLFPIHPT